MKTSLTVRFASEKQLGVRVRWALLATALLASIREAGPLALVALCCWGVLSCMISARCLKSLEQFERGGNRQLLIVRCVDVLMFGLSPFWMGESPLWLLTIPTVIIEGLVNRKVRNIWIVGVLAIGTQVLMGLYFHLTPLQFARVIAVVAVSPLIGLVLANFKSKEETFISSHSRLNSLMTVASGVSTSSNLRSMMLRALQNAVDEVGASAGYVMLISEEAKDRLVTEAAYGREGQFIFPTILPVGNGISGYVAKMAQPIEVHDDLGESLDCDGMDVQVRSAVSVPLINRSYSGTGAAASEEVLGTMTVLKCDTNEQLDSRDLDLMISIGSLMAAAITNARMEERQRATFVRTLESLATALEARDEYTQGHSQRVGDVSLLIGYELGFSPEALEELRVGTTLHDIGKIGVPDAILNKPGRLTEEEFELMKQHPVIGYEICKPLMLSDTVLMIIRNHHEKLDGSGYPDGLKGGELPLTLRIVCVADAFDAMSSRRPYRNVMAISSVIEEMSKGAGIQFDPVVVETLKNLLQAGRLDEIYRSYWEPGQEKIA